MRRLPALFVAAALGALAARAVPGSAPAFAAPNGPSGPADFTAVAAAAEGAVVHVMSYLSRPRDLPSSGDRGPTDEAMGSGFVLGADGWIVTNHHVVGGGEAIYVQVKGRGWLPARVVGTDPVIDIAVLKVEASGLPTLPVGDPRTLRLGAWVLAVGSPYRLARSFTAGIVSGLERSDVGTPNPFEDFIQHDAAVNVGSSGGPLLDASGRVVGVNTAILSRTIGNQGISFAVPVDVVVPSFESIRATGRPPRRASVGASVRDLAAREAIGVPGGVGQVLTRFTDDSAARRAGLVEGDVILAVDGVATPTRGALLRTLWTRGAGGRPVTFDVWRRGQRVAIAVTPVER